MTTRRRHYILCTYGEEHQSEFMYTRLIRCIQLVRPEILYIISGTTRDTQYCADENSRPVRPAMVPPLSLQIVVGQVSLHRHIDSKLVTIFIILYSENASQTSTCTEC